MALAGLPHLSIVLYVLGIRPRMDFANGTVGNRPLISWQALRESIYVEPHQGIKHEYASIQAVRRAAVWLEKVGLIRMRSDDRQLIFFLPLAHADNSVRKKADKGPTDQADKGPTGQNPHESSVSGDSEQVSRQTENGKADSHPVSGNSLYKNLPPSTTVVKGSAPEGGRAGELIYPTNLKPDQRAAMALKLDGIGADMAQAVLDELEGYTQAGEARNVAALFRKMVEQAKNGEFIASKGVPIRQARASRAAEEKRRQEYERKATEEAMQATKGAGQRQSLKDVLRQARAAQA